LRKLGLLNALSLGDPDFREVRKSCTTDDVHFYSMEFLNSDMLVLVLISVTSFRLIFFMVLLK